MARIERRTIPLPSGHHAFVVSDLSLTPSTNVQRRSLREFLNLLNEFDEGGLVVVAGNMFDPDSTSDLAKFIDVTLQALPDLRSAIESFCRRSGQLVVLPGSRDGDLARSGRAQGVLTDLGITLASDVIVNVATASGARDVAIVAGRYELDVTPIAEVYQEDADRLEDPLAVERFLSSRVLYRRLGPWVWLPLIVFALADTFTVFAALIRHFLHDKIHVHLVSSQGFWFNFLLDLVVIAASEALIAGLVGLIVRRRFDRRTAPSPLSHRCEPLAITMVEGVNALEYARRITERGGAGAIVGGTPRPALSFLEHGVCATPGPSRTVLVERRGRLGLPPVFKSFDRLGVVEVEAATEVQVRLFAGETSRHRGALLERLLAGPSTQPTLRTPTTTMSSWPVGDPYPLNLERLNEQHRQRSIRRVAAGLVLLDGLLNIVVTTVRPLRSHLHLVLSVLPLDVAKSAAAFTAVAGMAMIMLARGLRRGQRRSWFLASMLLSVTVIGHALRGGTIVSLLIAAALLALLVVQRRYFQATTDRTSASTALPRLGFIALVTVGAAAFGVEATGHGHHLANFGVVIVACVERLVGQYNIALPDRSADFINPTLLTLGAALIASTLYFVTRPVVDRRLSTAAGSAERRIAELRARDIVRRHGRGTLDYFALRDDKQFFFVRDSLVAYAVYGGVALVSPDPIGPDAERAEVFSSFREFAEGRGWTVGIMGASEEWLAIYHAAGLHYLYLGDEAIVDCPTFTLAGHKMKGLRQACNRLARNGYRVEFVDPARIDPAKVSSILELIAMLRRGGDERGFSMMLGRLFDPKDKGLLLTIVYGPNDDPVAVCQFVPSSGINGYSLDLMRRDPGDHPNGLIDFALCSTIEHLGARGYDGLSLNFAAFRSVLDGERGEGAFTRVERWALKRLSGVLPLETLWLFNAKYHPRWLPRHLVYPAAESFVPVVTAVLRAESITEIPLLGRFLVNDPANRPGTVVPEEVLAAARSAKKAG